MATYTAVAGGGNWNSAATWGGAGFPIAGDTAILNATSGQVTVTANATCLILNCTGYANTLTINNGITLTVNGVGATISLGGTINSATTGEISTIAGPGGSCTINFNGVTIPRLRVGGNAGGSPSTTVIGTGGVGTVANLTSANTNGGNSAITSGTLTVTNSISITGGNLSGNGIISIANGNNCSISTTSSGSMSMAITVLTGGTLTLSSTLSYLGSTITFNTSSTLVTNNNTLGLLGSTTLNTNSVSWYDVAMQGPAGTTMTLTSNLNISRNFTVTPSINNLLITSSGGPFNINVGGSLSVAATQVFSLGNNTTIILNGTNPGTNTIDGGGVVSGTLSITGNNYVIGTPSKLTFSIQGTVFQLSGATAAATVVSGHTLVIAVAGATITTNNTITGSNIGGNEIIWNNIQMGSNANSIFTLTYDTTATGNFAAISNTNPQSVNGGKLSIGGNLSVGSQGLAGTSTIEFIGTSPSTWGAGTYQNNITINKSGGTLTLLGTITWGTTNRTLQRTAGNINPGSSTVTIPNAAVTINNMVFNNLTFTGGASSTIAQPISNIINGTLTINAATTFTGVGGWTAAGFNSTTAGVIITLATGSTYTATSASTLTGTNASPGQLISNVASTSAIFTLAQGASQNISFITARDIDSSQGQTIWDWLGTGSATLTRTQNWNPIVSGSPSYLVPLGIGFGT